MNKIMNSIFRGCVTDPQARKMFLLCVMGHADRKKLQTRLKRLNGNRVIKLDWPYDLILKLRCAILESRNVSNPILLRSIFKRHGLPSGTEKVWDTIRELKLVTVIRGYKLAMPPDSTDTVNLLADILEETKSGILKFINWKLRFVIKYYSMSRDDLLSELQQRGIISFYRKYPYLPRKHLANYVERGAKNAGLSLITALTRKKRAEIVKADENPFTDYLITRVIGRDHLSGSQLLDRLDDTLISKTNEIEDRLNYQMFLDKCTNKQRKAIKVLTLNDDPKFVDYIKGKGLSKAKTVSGIARELGVPKFKKQVRLYTKMDKVKYKKFFAAFKGEAPDVSTLVTYS